MGCGGSRLINVNPESIPAKFRPILRHRIEEIRRRRRLGRTKDESTTKELLVNGKANDDEDTGAGEQKLSSVRKSNFSPDDSLTSCVTSEGSEKRSAEDLKAEKENERESEEREYKVGKVVAVAEGDQGTDKSGGEYTDLDGTDDEKIDQDSIFFPGSPSFRIYFVDNGEDDDDDEDGKLEGSEDKMQSRHDHPESSSQKESVTKKAKKVRKRRSLKKVIPRGGQAAVRNLLNVKSCYTPPCGTRHDRAHLLSEKPQA